MLHKAGIANLVTQQPVPQLYDDGLGKGRSAVDIWTMLPLDYDAAQAKNPPGVSYVLKKGDAAWSYNDLVQDSYSPKWELDFPPIDYRIQPGFINQSLGLTGLLYWSVDEDIENAVEAGAVVKTLKKSAQLPGIEAFDGDTVWAAIEAHRTGSGDDEGFDLKGPEWDVLTAPTPPTDYPFFMSKEADVPTGFETQINRVLLLERLREVNALLGFTRVESPSEDGNDRAPRAPISRGVPTWVPATQVHGEGILLQFDEGALNSWADWDAVKRLEGRLRGGYRGWRMKRRMDPSEGFPGMRYVLLHTVAHLLIRELALECGYNAASIRERVYADVGGGKHQAGILIYTAAADSDGTLGGLVELGRPNNLGRLLRQSLDRAKICASDPLCAEHDPTKDQSLHGAACHACSFTSETSCELGNRCLDRALAVATLEAGCPKSLGLGPGEAIPPPG